VFGVNHPTTGWTRTQNHLWAFGGHYVDPKDFEKSAAHLPPAQQALSWLHDRYWRDNSWIQPQQRPAPWNFWTGLSTGVIAIAEDGMHALKNMAVLEGLDWDIAPIPKGPAKRLSWITTDGWGLWNGSKARTAAWELMKFITGPDYLKLQSRIELLIPPRVSLLEDWMQVLRGKFPVLQHVNLKMVKDAMTASPPAVSTWEMFPCFADANGVIQPALNELYRDGTAKPAVFRDRKDQLEQAAIACGATFR
jgi:ABC-type glycerol-3-phosphate transport system substrate-binding protein